MLGPGETTGTANPVLEIDIRLDAGSFDGFESWTIGNANFRYLKGRIYVDTTAGKPVISGFNLLVDAASRTESGTYTTPAGGSVAVSFANEFHNTPVLQVTPQGSGVDYDRGADELYAVGTVGGEMFDDFFAKYEFKLALEQGGRAKASVEDACVVRELAEYCRQQVKC